MATFFMFGSYTAASASEISAARTRKANALIKAQGGKVKGMYALLGGHDLALIVDLPDLASAVKLSLELLRLTGISFSTSPALPVQEFDKLAHG